MMHGMMRPARPLMHVNAPKPSTPTQKVLKALLDASPAAQSGYEISQATGLWSGTMYPVLQRLEYDALISGEWLSDRKLYALTAAGHAEAAKAA